LISDADIAKAPASLKSKQATAAIAKFVVQSSPLDCTGCESCVRSCPVNKNAKEGDPKVLEMKPLRSVASAEEANYEFVNSITSVKQTKFPESTVLGVQFKKPYFEFSGACSGCGETPYVTLVSRLFGDRMMIANATGCSSIYGGSAPSNPYTIDAEGCGPSWANSLFEDNAEFGFGMQLAIDYQRSEAYDRLQGIATIQGGEIANAINDLIANKNKPESKQKSKTVIELLNKLSKSADVEQAIKSADQLSKKST
jgi:pyruvate-ferredoxin/flavodoxin oxidoreductase